MRIPSQGSYRIIVFWRRASTQEAENWSCETLRSYRFSLSQTWYPRQRTLGSAGSWVGGPLSWAAGPDPGPPSDRSVPALQYRQHSHGESRCFYRYTCTLTDFGDAWLSYSYAKSISRLIVLK